jgi:hypothetical protein
MAEVAISLLKEEMKEENLANTLDRILAERLREFPANRRKRLRDGIHWAVRSLPRFAAKASALPDSSAQAEIIARIRSLPAHVQEPLRRYFVFREAEESICSSIRTTPGEFRRFLRDAANYILMRHDRAPQMQEKPWPRRTSNGR